MNVRNHKDLQVYKLAIKLVSDIYKITDLLPASEEYGLKSQMRRAAVSIPSNIAEGAARKGTKEFIQFLYHSLSSTAEIETQYEICKNLGYLESNVKIERDIHKVVIQLTHLINSLKDKLGSR